MLFPGELGQRCYFSGAANIKQQKRSDRFWKKKERKKKTKYRVVRKEKEDHWKKSRILCVRVGAAPRTIISSFRPRSMRNTGAADGRFSILRCHAISYRCAICTRGGRKNLFVIYIYIIHTYL